ncbi:MAG: methyltransferase family protein [Acidobacteria bacterium]|jgi:SAM-dependent methyltransferase|nr:methyltransferase family protein [Acidobacteriota bacterium]
MENGYGEDLAYIHDAGFGAFSLNAAPGLLDILRRSGICGGLVVDLGCGNGLWARRVVDAGYSVLGIDMSPEMIALARSRVPEGRFLRRSLFSADLPDCDAVTSIGECFNYLFDSNNSWASLTRVLRRIFKALRKGGVLVFDLAGPGRLCGRPPVLSHYEGKDWAILVRAAEDEHGSTLTRKITAFRRVGEFYRRTDETHRLRLYDAARVAGGLRAIGFSVRVLRGYGQLRFVRGHAAFLARKV